MTWDAPQLEALYDNVYRRRMVCPACGGALIVGAETREASGAVVAMVACRACGARHLVSPASDPRRGAFRAYTPDECRALFAVDRAGRTPVCPVDGTEMSVHLQRSLGRTSNATIRCRRCGRQAEYVRPHG